MFSFPPLSTMSRPIKNRPCSIQSPVYRDIELTVIVNYESVADHRRHNSYDKLRYIFGKSCLRVLISIFANTPLFNLLKTSETCGWQNQLNKITNNKPATISINQNLKNIFPRTNSGFHLRAYFFDSRKIKFKFLRDCTMYVHELLNRAKRA